MSNSKFSYDPLNNDIDLRWAGNANTSDNRFSNYYDYYFSGEDIKVYIDGLFGQDDELDIASFAYVIKQEKQPLYGFWSYNFDSVLVGSRLITGEFTVFTRHPRRMTELLEKAAVARSSNASDRKLENSIVSKMNPSLSSSENERNIQKYWANSQLDRITIDPAGSKSNHIFSSHPPFNFVILYGAEETAISPVGAARNEEYFIRDNLDRMIYSDVNQRSTKIDNISSPMKIILQHVHLMSMSTAYTPGGQPVGESYQFIARDYYFSEADLSFVKNLSASVISDDDGLDNDSLSTSSTTTGYYPSAVNPYIINPAPIRY